MEVDEYGESKKIDFEITEYADGSEITENYTPCYDVICLDIEMPVLNGMSAARMIRQKDASETAEI